jgi:hypothetical protein
MNTENSSWLEGEGPVGSVGRRGRKGRMRRVARARPRCAKPSAARDGVFAYYDGHHRGRGEAAPVCPALACIAPQGILFWGRERVSHPSGCFHTGHYYGEAALRGWHGDWLGRWTKLGCCARGRARSFAKGRLSQWHLHTVCLQAGVCTRPPWETGREGVEWEAKVGKRPATTRHDPPRPGVIYFFCVCTRLPLREAQSCAGPRERDTLQDW